MESDGVNSVKFEISVAETAFVSEEKEGRS
jgi:hypothetical protein